MIKSQTLQQAGQVFNAETISPAAREVIKERLAPLTLGRSADRFDIGVEFAKAELLVWLEQRFGEGFR